MLDCLCWRNKIPQTGLLRQQTFIFSHLGGQKSEVRCQHGWSLVRTLSGFQIATFLLDAHMAFPYICTLRWRVGSLAFFCKAANPFGASLMTQMVKNLPTVQRPGFNPGVGKIPWRRKWQPTPLFLPGEFQGQRSLAAAVHGVAKSWDTTERLTLCTPPVLLDLDPTFMMPCNQDYLLKAWSPNSHRGITAAT